VTCHLPKNAELQHQRPEPEAAKVRA
jgi:hypothetical protein